MNGRVFFGNKRNLFIFAMLCTILWGIGFPMIKLGYQYLHINSEDVYSKLLFAGVRFFAAGVLTIGVTSAADRKIPAIKGRMCRDIFVLALVQTVGQYAFQYIGLANVKGMIGSILNQINVFLLVFISPLFFREEKLSLSKTIGSIIGMIGIVIINFNGSFEFSFHLTGEGFIILASLFAAAGIILCKKLTAHYRPIVVAGYQQMFGGLLLLLTGIAGGGKLYITDIYGAFVLVFLCGSAALTNLLWTVLLKYNPVYEVSVYKFGVPVFGTIASAMILNENMASFQVLSALLCVAAGIYIVNGAGKKVKI